MRDTLNEDYLTAAQHLMRYITASDLSGKYVHAKKCCKTYEKDELRTFAFHVDSTQAQHITIE